MALGTGCYPLLFKMRANFIEIRKQEARCITRRSMDYTHGRTVLVNGIPSDLTNVFITLEHAQPFSNAEELADAGLIAKARSDEIVSGGMPPFITREFPDGTSQRILNLAITSGNSSRSVFVNMNNRTVESPPDATKNAVQCVAPPLAQGKASGPGVPGTANLVINTGLECALDLPGHQAIGVIWNPGIRN